MLYMLKGQEDEWRQLHDRVIEAYKRLEEFDPKSELLSLIVVDEYGIADGHEFAKRYKHKNIIYAYTAFLNDLERELSKFI